MTDYSSLLQHVDAEEIISKLITGSAPKEVSQWLRIKYTDKEQKHLHLSVKLLQDYVNNHVGNMMDHLQKDIIKLKENPSGQDVEIQNSLLNNASYRARLESLATTEIDIKLEVKNLVLAIRERMEQIFDVIQSDPYNVGRADYVLLQYFQQLNLSMERYDKIVNSAPDMIVQHNISVQIADKTKIAFQNAISKVLSHIDSESAIKFVDYLVSELEDLEVPLDVVPTPESREKILNQLVADTGKEKEKY